MLASLRVHLTRLCCVSQLLVCLWCLAVDGVCLTVYLPVPLVCWCAEVTARPSHRPAALLIGSVCCDDLWQAGHNSWTTVHGERHLTVPVGTFAAVVGFRKACAKESLQAFKLVSMYSSGPCQPLPRRQLHALYACACLHCSRMLVIDQQQVRPVWHEMLLCAACHVWCLLMPQRLPHVLSYI